ncbi:hypothetical protein EDM68_02465 [Candidatus Uhrbacteria bacterium]|nr:MAG: hypothetical protein EDM68_02465 [Candidatus Uhrbacteria bacterium]
MDDQTLTLFLMESMTLSFGNGLKRVEKSTIPGTIQRTFKREGLLYLETVSGTNLGARIDIYVIRADPVRAVYGIDIITEFDANALTDCHVMYTDVLGVLHRARLAGFERTRAEIAAGRNDFCLFRIPDYEEPAPVGKYGVPGALKYAESIDDHLDFFGGGEEIHFQPTHGGGRTLLFRSQIQGRRL